MQILLPLYITVTLILGWILFGYFIYLYIRGSNKTKKQPNIPDKLPFMSVVVPCYNEENRIIDKLNDLKGLDYPADLMEVIFVDGGSSDRTVQLLKERSSGNFKFRMETSLHKGKINQINHILPQLKGEIIVITDVDGFLSKGALKWIAAEFENCRDAYVVGAFCYPGKALDIEHYYWFVQNIGRLLETRAHTSSMVIAQCYAFRKGLLNAFPEDVAADDVYIALLANTLGWEVIYSRYAIASETRAPQDYAEFFLHKLRKSHNVLREFIRFSRRILDMDNYFKICFMTRFAQQLILPWICILWLLMSGILVAFMRFEIVILSILFLAALFILARQVMSRIELPGSTRKYSITSALEGCVAMSIVMLCTALYYPFHSHGSDYRRIGSNN